MEVLFDKGYAQNIIFQVMNKNIHSKRHVLGLIFFMEKIAISTKGVFVLFVALVIEALHS